MLLAERRSFVNLICEIVAGYPCLILWRVIRGNANPHGSRTPSFAGELFTAVRASANPGRIVPSMTIYHYQYDIGGGAVRQARCERTTVDSRTVLGDHIVAQRRMSRW